MRLCQRESERLWWLLLIFNFEMMVVAWQGLAGYFYMSKGGEVIISFTAFFI